MIDELIKKYNDKFGPIPYFLIRGADDDYIAGLITRAFAENKPIDELDTGEVLY